MDVLEVPRYEDQLVPITPVNGYQLVGCSDKRAPQADDPVLIGPYHQLLGGVEVGQDFGIAWEAQEPGSFVELGIPIEELDLLVAGAAQAHGILVAGHRECAALNNRQAILGTQARTPITESGSAFLRAKAAYGGAMSIGDHQALVAAARRIEDAGLMTSTAEATAALQTPRPELALPDGVPFAQLTPTGDARAFVVSHVPKSGFNTQQTAQDNPAYISTVPAIDTLHEAARYAIRVDKDLVRMAYAARLAAISLHHITQEDGTPYPLYVIDRERQGQLVDA